ncbi:DUF6351 family protein [Thalassotalea sp. PLHSN55]|uniref:DUF6351 family protein n=1 Tax=Thalassotalea sp. PLHSN55 TaxID=3435888 RepID=UPI003F85E412
MIKRILYRIILITVALVIVLVGASLLYFNKEKASFDFRQVKAIAPTSDSYLLTVDTHISNSIRPAETFNFPIALGQQGPNESLYSGPLQYPFYCMTLNTDLGQPNVDNQLGYGVPVYQSIESKDKIIGYSKDCGANSRLNYYGVNEQKNIVKLIEEKLTNKEIAQQYILDEKLLGIFRVEQGTINRFIYTLIMPITLSEVGDRLAQSQWNKRLIYQFNGGSGIGYRQGKQKHSKVLKRQVEQLLDGYAVISSSGNRTSYTYNMLLAEDTARRVKKQFTSLYGQPLYTVGIGGSGGGLAQYLIAQNSTGILDGLIPLYSYPDMITQTTYALDCDLLNNYFTFRADKRSAWLDWQKRRQIEGMNATNDFPQRAAYLQPMNQIMAGFVPSLPKGNSECINGYFGLSSFINNPKQGFIREFFHPKVSEQVKWSYWQDLKAILGTDKQGYGLSTWDNVGVQYGLKALINNTISFEEFFDINEKIGSWKPQQQMVKESIFTPFGRKIPLWLSLWGNNNITEGDDGVAPRHQGSISAMQAAYRWGQVFIGKVDLPILDVRHYLEDELDMHHISASFYSRLRIEKANGHAINHVIWIADKNYNPAHLAFKVMDEWLLALRDKQQLASQSLNQETEPLSKNTVESKPEYLNDACFDASGAIIAQGNNVWNGSWNNKADGKCHQLFPMYSTSRIQAGSRWAGDLFKCQLISIESAIQKGIYGKLDLTPYLARLKQIFPDGVCDYQQVDVGRPANI